MTAHEIPKGEVIAQFRATGTLDRILGVEGRHV